MSSRSNGVTNVRLSRSTISCVSRSPSCSSSLIAAICSTLSSGNVSSSPHSRRGDLHGVRRRPASRGRRTRASAGVRRRRTRCPAASIRLRRGRLSEPAAIVIAGGRKNRGFQAYRGVEPPRFVNAAELECAKVLDYYGVPWMYEPRTFVLEEDADGKVLEAFTPDFYLPEQDLYLEITVMKQALVDAQEPQAAQGPGPLSGRQRQALLQARHRAPGPAIRTEPRLLADEPPGNESPGELFADPERSGEVYLASDEIGARVARARRADRGRLRGPRAAARLGAEGELRLPRRPLAGDADPARDRLRRARRVRLRVDRRPEAGHPAPEGSRHASSLDRDVLSSRTSSTPG